MKTIVFGATGATGQQLVQQALEAGHEVTAFARTPEKVTRRHDRLRVAQGDVRNPSAVNAALVGKEGVLIALGTKLKPDDQTIAQGTRNILAAMQLHGAGRLVVESAWGTGDSRRYGGFFLNYLVRPLLLSHPFAQHEIQEEDVAKSAVDWTIVRPGRLTNGAKERTLRGSRTPGGLSQKVSRAEVAAFMITELERREFSRQAILIG